MTAPLTVYVDFKSPYAYLAIEPTRQMAKELGIEIDWRPFVLDIPSYLGSARLDSAGKVVKQQRSDNQWSKVKYAYFDCRRYANLRGITLRGTEKIWDTNLAAIGMLWAKQQGDGVLQRYMDGIYTPFWRRELDVESRSVIGAVLGEAGAMLDGFDAFVDGEGAAQNRDLQLRAFDSGIFGVPTFEVAGERFFGREHLPRIRWLLQGCDGPAPDIAFDILPGSQVTPSDSRLLEVGICRADPESLLALAPIVALQDFHGIDLRWSELPARQQRDVDLKDLSRGGRHRRFRVENRERDWLRYGVDAPEQVSEKIDAQLAAAGIRLEAERPMTEWQGMASMSGYVGSPMFRLGEESFVGRQHLPLISARLTAAIQ